jgi:hypothetical protein
MVLLDVLRLLRLFDLWIHLPTRLLLKQYSNNHVDAYILKL